MRYKRLVLLFVGIMAFFVALNYVVWRIWTEDLFTDHHYDGGDLCRTGFIPYSKVPRRNHTDLPRQHIRLKNYIGQRIDVITIGDSFSNGGGGGRNRFYQDYIATLNNLSVLSLDEYKRIDFISMISLFNNSGFFDKANPRYVIIGATERGYKDMAVDVDFDKTFSMSELRKLPIKDHYVAVPDVQFINDGNMKFIVNCLVNKFRDHGLFGNVYIGSMSRDLFSVKNGSNLLYIPLTCKFEYSEVIKINDNMNKLADRLRRKGIQLIYMPYVDKYTLYCKWLVNKRHKESTFFEMLRPLPKRYIFIDTKAILRSEVEMGKKDVFYADDTHSSWKASEIIFKTFRFKK